MRSKKISRQVAQDIRSCRERIEEIQEKGLEGLEEDEINSIMKETMDNFTEVTTKVRDLFTHATLLLTSMSHFP